MSDGDPARTDQRYLIGIDAGGTKIHLRCAACSGEPEGDDIIPAEHWTELEPDEQAAMLTDRLRALGWDRPAAIGIGAHGCDTDAEAAALTHAVRRRIDVATEVVNDAFLLPAAHSRSPLRGDSAGLVVGTGSIAVARDAGGNSLYVGGWGWLLGDPGSAWGTVREAVRQLTLRADRSDRPEQGRLARTLLGRSGAHSLRELVTIMEQQPATLWAQWAAAVYDAADQGSTTAASVINAGVAELVDMVAILRERGARVTGVVAGGGVITHQPFLEQRLRTELGRRLDLTLTVCHNDPVDGAVGIARALTAAAGRSQCRTPSA